MVYMRTNYGNIGVWFNIFVMVCVIIIILSSVGYYCIAGLEAILESNATITIKEKIGAHGEEGIYLITTEGGEQFIVEDNLFKFKIDATDRYAALDVGKKYNVRCTGMRFHLFSWYRNIISFEEILET